MQENKNNINNQDNEYPTSVHALTKTDALGETHEGGCACDHCSRFPSPFHIDTGKAQPLPENIAINLRFGPTPIHVEKKFSPRDPRQNNFHILGTPGSTLNISNGEIHFSGSLVNLHWHFDGEHIIDGKRYAGELHFVFKDKEDKIAVVGVMVEEGPQNSMVQDVLSHLGKPDAPGFLERVAAFFKSIFDFIVGNEQEKPKDPTVDFSHAFPRNPEIIYTTGETTTGNEKGEHAQDVQWVLFRQPITMSREQIKQFEGIIGGKNNRIVQPSIEERPVYLGRVESVKQWVEKQKKTAKSTQFQPSFA